jgi:membrane-associated phospholipid phosphatase
MLLPLTVVLAVVTRTPAAPHDVDPSPTAPSSVSDGAPASYLTEYGAEYLAVIASATLLFTKATEGIEPLSASIGPAVSLAQPDSSLIFDPRLNDVIGRPILQEKVPELGLAVAIAASVAAGAGVDFAARQDLHRTHAIVLGSVEAVLGAALITEGMKLGFGRLRPDFRERWLRASCAGVVSKPEDVDCASINDGFIVDRAFLLDGMKSFPSAHASTAAAAATFLVLELGSEHLWASHAAEWARPLAGLAVGGLLAGAGYVTMTRVSDHRHHLEDVAVGAGIGIASGMAAYLVHFDIDGRARRRGSASPDGTATMVVPWPIEGGAGAAWLGSF